VSLGTRASEAASIDGIWAYGRNFSVSALGRGYVIRIVYKIALMHVLIQVLDLLLCYKMINNLVDFDISTFYTLCYRFST